MTSTLSNPWHAVSPGKGTPETVNAIIEIPKNTRAKYELDKDAGVLVVDRFLYTPMSYPGNYGFVPHTLCGDGDPVDVLVIMPTPLIPGSVVKCRPVGVLKMTDEEIEELQKQIENEKQSAPDQDGDEGDM